MNRVEAILVIVGFVGLLMAIAHVFTLRFCVRWHVMTGDFRKSLWLIRQAWVFAPKIRSLEGAALEYLGYFRQARAARDRFLNPAWLQTNSDICLNISIGRYEQALADAKQAGRWPTTVKTPLPEWGLVRVNVSEALYNRGLWNEALAALDGVEEGAWGVTRSGAINQRCWIFCHTGRATEAMALHVTADRNGLPPTFFAEHHFTRALCLLELKRFDESAAELDIAETFAMRISSKRNLIYMRARLAMARGDFEAAEKLYRLGAKHRYRGQGGEALLAWGDCLVKLERPEEARTAWELCVRRDPQSESAATARHRLGAAV